nr:efflux RND transporter permease subunit [Oceanococcus sp. HetDA_MAG_MS8]
MQQLIAAAVEYQRSVLLILLLVLVVGAVTYTGIPKESDPDVPIPYIYVSMVHDGISPEDAERLLVRPMEQKLRAIEGVKEMTSSARQGSASVTLEFDAGFDADQALLDVREEVDQARQDLPAESEEPTVHEINVALFPVILVTLSGLVDERVLVHAAQNLRDELEGLSGVLEVEISGAREEQLEILIDPLLLETYGIEQASLFNLIARNNQLVAAGNLETQDGQFPVKVPGLIESAEDLFNLPILVDGERVVRMADVALVRRSFRDASSIARSDGETAITLEVKKRIGENVIDTIAQVRAVVAQAEQRWPAGVQASFSQDSSEDIKMMLGDLQNNVLTAVLLVVIVVVGILGVRSAGLVAVAIPGAFLIGILVIAMMGLTINIMVLFSLIMAVGLLVDGAIVVVELADRKMCEGYTRKEAYRIAAQRMAWPITASTATTLAAFLPLLFWPGIMGEFMKYLPITLIATLTASLFMALIFVPALGGVIGRPGAVSPALQAELAAAESGDLDKLRGLNARYVKTLEWLVEHPGRTLMGAFAAVVMIFVSYISFGPGVEFFPDVEPQNAQVKVRARGDMSLQQRNAIVAQVEERIFGREGIRHITTRVGSSNSREGAADVIGTISLEFLDWDQRAPAETILDQIREDTADIAGIELEIRAEENGPNSGKPVTLELQVTREESLAKSTSRLRRGVEEIHQRMRDLGGFVDMDDNLPLPGIEWQLEVDRLEASRYGVDVSSIGNAVQLITNGVKLGTYRPEDADDELDIRIRYLPRDRHLGELDRLTIATPAGPVPLAHFVERRPVPKVGSIYRSGMQRTSIVGADVETGLLVDDQIRKLRQSLQDQPLSVDGLAVVFRGEDEDQRESQAFLSQAFLAALFVMLVILVTQFNSFYQAGLVLSAVLFSTAAVLLGLLLMNKPFGIVMSGVGVISLAGIVVNNNIVLIDTYNVLRRQGMEAVEAVLRTGAQRLRPVLMTSATTILGLLPMVLQLNIDLFSREVTYGAPASQWWVQLAAAVAGGLAFATPITLFLTPVLLAWQGRRQDRQTTLRPATEVELQNA